MLMSANLEKNRQRVVDVREVLEPISEAWHQIVASGQTGQR